MVCVMCLIMVDETAGHGQYVRVARKKWPDRDMVEETGLPSTENRNTDYGISGYEEKYKGD